MKLLALVLILASACSRSPGEIDSYIGDTCVRDSDCDSRCYQDNQDFPGGFCSISCRSDADCPSDTACIDKAGGVCLFLCTEVDCAAALGPGWHCSDKERVTGGKDNVCIGD